MDRLSLEIRRETDLKRQIGLVNQIVQICGYPKARGKFARQLVRFVCSGTDEESTFAGSLTKKRLDQEKAKALAPSNPPLA